MEKFNKFVEEFVASEAEYEAINKKAEEMSVNAYTSFMEGVESKIATWTKDDLVEFIKFAKVDGRINPSGIAMIIEKYSKTHKRQDSNDDGGIIYTLALIDVLCNE